MLTRSLAAIACLVSPSFIGHLQAERLTPLLHADFQGEAPQWSVAPGEKRFGRSTLPGVQYGKHPYDAHSKRLSLKSALAQGEDGKRLLRLESSMSADVLGGFNPRSGTLSVWLRTPALASEEQPILSVRNSFTETYDGRPIWQLGLKAGGRLSLTTPAVNQCDAPPPPEGEWVHLVAVWDSEMGARLYLNGQLAGSVWQQDLPVESEEALFDTGTRPELWRNVLFRRGIGERKHVPLDQTQNWGGDSITTGNFAEGHGLLINKKDSERLQIRTPSLLSLAPGQYTLLAEVHTEGATGTVPAWAPRLSIRSQGETRLLGFSGAGAKGNSFPFEITESEGDATISLDLNFNSPGRYKVQRLLVQRATPESTPLSPTPVPLPAERLVLHASPDAATAVTMRDLRVYARPFSALGVAALYNGQSPDESGLEDETVPDPDLRRASLGWDRPALLPSARAGQTLLFRQAPVLEARENLRAAGWRAVSGFIGDTFPWAYHGYSQQVDRELHLKLAFTPNWLFGQGEIFDGTLGEHPFQPPSGWFGRPIDAKEPTLHIRHRSGTLSQLGFYHISEAPLAPHQAEAYPLWDQSIEILSTVNQRELISGYPHAEQQILGTYQRASHPPTTRLLPALQASHFVSSKMIEEYPLGGIGLRLRLATPLASPCKARLTVHDPASPWRELARIECTLEPEPSSGSEYTLLLDLRDTLLLPGSAAWVTITFDGEINLRIGSEGSELLMIPAEDASHAATLWREWELRSIRDCVERLSEPRPWGKIGLDGESGWWLATSTPVFEQITTGLERLRARFPEDATLKAYHAFTHPKAPSTVREIPLPNHGNHPEWALLARECLRQYQAFVDFWIDQRQVESGEFGHFYGDDTDLVQDWLDLTLIADPTGKYTDSLSRLARGLAESFILTGGRDAPRGKPVKGEPILRDGLNVRWTDVLHAYEEGLNVQPPDFIAHYGDPIRFQRLLDTVARYDGFILTPEINGIRRFSGQGTETAFVNTQHLSGNPNDKYWHLMLHAGLVTSWYNGDPTVWSMLEALAQGDLQQNTPLPEAAQTLLQAIFRKNGDPATLTPFIDAPLWKTEKAIDSNTLTPNTWERLARSAPQEFNKALTLKTLSRDSAERYASHPSTTLGWGDDRHLRNWLEWKLSGDEKHLLTGLRELYRDLVSLMPMRTVAEQSGDRVSPPKQLISQLYLGGIPGSRNRHFQPDFAISYRGLGDNFAARVLENRPDNIVVELYSFADTSTSGEILVWSLEAGEYKIAQKKAGSDEDTATSSRFLRRGDSFPITLPPGSIQQVTITQTTRAAEPALLGDAALAAEKITRNGHQLLIPVYNLGVPPLHNLTITLQDKDGHPLAERALEHLPGIKAWKLGEAFIAFEKIPKGAVSIEVTTPAPEITTSNNRAPLPMP